MNKPHLIIADDFTGANDTGVKLVRFGKKVNVVFNLNSVKDEVSYVLDTETRNENSYQAEQVVSSKLENIDFNRFSVVFKKVDSTLRGNIVEEIKTINRFYQPDLVVFAPALPAENRTVENKNLYVNGQRVDKTEFAKDPQSPVKEFNIFKILEKAFGRKYSKHFYVNDLKNLPNYLNKNIRYFSFDTLNEEQFKFIVKPFIKTNKKILWIGSAGLMDCLTEINSSVLPSLGLVGSVSKETNEQLREAQKYGCKLISLPIYKIYKSGDYESYVNRATQLLDKKKDVILMSSASYDSSELDRTINNFHLINIQKDEMERIVQTVLAGVCRRVIAQTKISGLFATGGSTAKGLLQIVKATEATILGEISWGVPIMKIQGGEFNNLLLVTKAGAFGDKLVIPWIMNKIKSY